MNIYQKINKQTKLSQSGIVGTLMLVVVVLLIVGGVGYLILNNQSSSNTLPLTQTNYQPAKPTPKTLPSPDYSQQKVTDKAQILLTKNSFTPLVLQVKKGSTVTWINSDTTAHKLIVLGVFPITKDTPDANLTTDPIEPSSSASFTFDKVGSFSYYLQDNISLKGTINVVE